MLSIIRIEKFVIKKGSTARGGGGGGRGGLQSRVCVTEGEGGWKRGPHTH